MRLDRRRLMALAASVTLAPFGAVAAGQKVVLPDPPSGKGQIVFFRRWYYGGGANTYMVREGERDIGRLPNANYFNVFVDPGWHAYTVKAERHKTMQIEVEAGETYYVMLELGTGLVLYQPDLTPTEQRAFDAISERLTRSAPVE